MVGSAEVAPDHSPLLFNQHEQIAVGANAHQLLATGASGCTQPTTPAPKKA